MKNGMIYDIGSHDELVDNGEHYAEMWNAQAQWYKEQIVFNISFFLLDTD